MALPHLQYLDDIRLHPVNFILNYNTLKKNILPHV